MADLRQRTLARSAASGDLHDQARLLVERLRGADPCAKCGVDGFGWHRDPVRRVWQIMAETGEPLRTITDEERAKCPECAGFGSVLRARVALAAYAGSKAAREALPTHEGCDPEWAGRHFGYGLREYDLTAFLAGLARWSAKPFHAPARAAKANHDRGCQRGDPACGFPLDTFIERGPEFCAKDISISAYGVDESSIRTAIQQGLVSWSLGP